MAVKLDATLFLTLFLVTYCLAVCRSDSNRIFNDACIIEGSCISYTSHKGIPFSQVYAKYGNRRKLVTIFSEFGWIQVVFPIDDGRDVLKTYRLNYKRKEDETWIHTKFPEQVFESASISRVIPTSPCPGWREKKIFCIFASDYIQTKDESWTYYEAEIESKSLHPSSEGNVGNTEKYAFEFKIWYCNRSQSSGCSAFPGLKTSPEESSEQLRQLFDECDITKMTREEWSKCLGAALSISLSVFSWLYIFTKRRIMKKALDQIRQSQSSKMIPRQEYQGAVNRRDMHDRQDIVLSSKTCDFFKLRFQFAIQRYFSVFLWRMSKAGIKYFT